MRSGGDFGGRGGDAAQTQEPGEPLNQMHVLTQKFALLRWQIPISRMTIHEATGGRCGSGNAGILPKNVNFAGRRVMGGSGEMNH
jgi:hypothetical protein